MARFTWPIRVIKRGSPDLFALYALLISLMKRGGALARKFFSIILRGGRFIRRPTIRQEGIEAGYEGFLLFDGSKKEKKKGKKTSLVLALEIF